VSLKSEREDESGGKENVWKAERNRQKNSFSVMKKKKAIKMQY
jgi:hypothetical protein